MYAELSQTGNANSREPARSRVRERACELPSRSAGAAPEDEARRGGSARSRRTSVFVGLRLAGGGLVRLAAGIDRGSDAVALVRCQALAPFDELFPLRAPAIDVLVDLLLALVDDGADLLLAFVNERADVLGGFASF